ncbi:alcohol dehydrogenase [Mycolicibacterium canariasense]|uniref:enoyl-[acyl-carrier-protein] reductase n=1 Tax=Mycolicibacterium canariasense TaxID=228230 RepID=A0A100WEX6_MYCCR|nr:zinc-dependent alcohol dehydrogenase family protein [Mycolicibacterium canariasense]MCV7211667.1 zinc-dependent alcohol dehydrogenase family protein [Mycolicibacterium canariasense]ORV00454.1 trans-2-enoyl-CoA reductase [Mycolicibacterium canariasense]GAS96925.1 alcohol dehydrogenase [Mycolicibacterium canariasense]
MQHLVLTEFGDPQESVQLVDGAEPAPGPGDVVVRMEAAAINPSDLLLIEGRYLARPALPATVGAEGVGIVEATGPGVDDALVGRRVVVLPTFKYGTWSQKVVAAQNDVVVVPGDDPVQLAMLSINPVTAHLLLERITALEIGDWVGQTAANSAVGLQVITLAKRRGVKTLNVVRRADAVDDIRRAGGDVVLVSGPDLAAEITSVLGEDKLRLVLDPLGGSAAAPLISTLEFGGSVVSYGTLIGPPQGLTPADLFQREIRHTGFWLGNWYFRAPAREIRAILGHLATLTADGQLHVPVEATYRLHDHHKAFQHAQTTQRGGKVLFTFD